MKKSVTRILGLALALVLALSTSVAFAMPSGTSAIEGLPEMPTVPTMTTSAKGTEVTVTMSEKLNWLNFVQNWNWLPITWSDDGLTGTYSTKDLSTQPGYATKHNNQSDELVYNPFKDKMVNVDTPYAEEYWDPYTDASDVGDSWAWEDFSHKNFPDWEGYRVHKEMAYGSGYYVEIPTAIYRNEWVDMEGKTHSYYGYTYAQDYILSDGEDEEVAFALGATVLAANFALYEKYDKLGDEDALNYISQGLGMVDYHADGIVRIYDRYYTQSFGNYELPDDFAYDGETADGVHVRYGRFGELVQIGMTLTGVNYLGTDKTPTKTIVYWRPLNHKGKNVSKFYINQITEEYEDGTKLSAPFSSSMGGKYLGSKPE